MCRRDRTFGKSDCVFGRSSSGKEEKKKKPQHPPNPLMNHRTYEYSVSSERKRGQHGQEKVKG